MGHTKTTSPPSGYVRVTSIRSSAALDNGPQADETVYRVDRANPVLGNRHILFNRHDSAERRRVIAAYGVDLERDMAANGPMTREIHQIAERVHGGEQICLACWCAPSPCHADLIATKVRERVEQMEHLELATPPRSAERAA